MSNIFKKRRWAPTSCELNVVITPMSRVLDPRETIYKAIHKAYFTPFTTGSGAIL